MSVRSLSSSTSRQRLTGANNELRKAVSKYNSLQEELWARSRQAVSKRHRIEEAEAREAKTAHSDEEKRHICAVFALKRRAAALQVQVRQEVDLRRV